MHPLPPIPQPGALLSFDFDGTLHDPAQSPPVPIALCPLLRQLRDQHGAVWGINTGRSLEHLMEGLHDARLPFLPDWVVAREREIYLADAAGCWQPHQPWNRNCEEKLHGLFAATSGVLAAIRHLVEEHTGAEWMAFDGEPAGFIAETEAEMEWIVAQITPMVADTPQLGWQRNSIYLRFGHRDLQKGSSMAELARHYGVAADRCFAMGDSHNDLEMLDPVHARMVACPANAVEEVRDYVRTRGGHMARAAYGAGVIEALQHYFPTSKE